MNTTTDDSTFYYPIPKGLDDTLKWYGERKEIAFKTSLSISHNAKQREFDLLFEKTKPREKQVCLSIAIVVLFITIILLLTNKLFNYATVPSYKGVNSTPNKSTMEKSSLWLRNYARLLAGESYTQWSIALTK